MEGYERILKLFYEIVNEVESGHSVNHERWSDLVDLSVRSDVVSSSKLCDFFRKVLELVQYVTDKAIHNATDSLTHSLCTMFAIVVQKCSQMPHVLKNVFDIMLRNARGYMHDEYSYSKFTQHLLSITDSNFWMTDTHRCATIDLISAQYFSVLSALLTDKREKRTLVTDTSEYNETTNSGEPEIRFWQLVCLTQFENRNSILFDFLLFCNKTDHKRYEQCFCSCFKDEWRLRFDAADETFDKRLDKLEKLVSNKEDERKQVEQHVEPERVAENGKDNNQSEFDSETSTWAINSEENNDTRRKQEFQQNEVLFAPSGLNELSAAIVRASIIKAKSEEIQSDLSKVPEEQLTLKNSKSSKHVEFIIPNKLVEMDVDEDSYKSDDGKTESSIESLPFDEPEPVHDEGIGAQLRSVLNVRLLKFNDEEEVENVNDELSIIIDEEKNITINNQRAQALQPSLPSSIRPLSEVRIKSSIQRIVSISDATIPNKQLVQDRAVSPLVQNMESVSIQTEIPIVDSDSSQESVPPIAKKLILSNELPNEDASTQTITPFKAAEIFSSGNDVQFLYVENMKVADIQNVFKLAKTFSDIC